MKAFLLYKDRDFELPRKLADDDRAPARNVEPTRWNSAEHDLDARQKLPSSEESLMQDLELTTLFNAMALGDKFLFEVSKKALLSGLYNDSETILYRQDILKDCLKNAGIVREIYATASGSYRKRTKVVL